jgi:hypothetical protein
MSKEKVFIVVSHSRLPSKDRAKQGQWEVTEKIEFVDQLRKRHIDMSSITVDYLEEKVLYGNPKNIQYDEFIKYVTERCPRQMKELNETYKPSPKIEVVEGEIKVEGT